MSSMTAMLITDPSDTGHLGGSSNRRLVRCGADDSVGELVYVNEAGETVREAVPLETGDYGRVYDALYDTLVNGQPNYVKESDVLTNMEILERGFEQPSPATLTLAK